MSKPKLTTIENQLKNYLKWCANVKQVTPQTIDVKKSILTGFIREVKVVDLTELTNKKIDKWIEGKVSGKFGTKCNANTIRTSIATIVAWLRWEVDMGTKLNLKIRMITKPKPAPSTRKWYTAKDVSNVLSECDELLDEVMIRVLFDTGLRAFEFAKLRIKDIHGRKIQIIGKGRKQDWVYISELTRKRLDLWIELSKANDFLWIKCTNKQYYVPMTVDGIRKRIKRAFEKAGYNNLQMHELRHSFATDLRLNGAEMDEIQKLMRHSSLQVTERYLHNLDGDLCDVWDRIKGNSLKPVNNDKLVIIGNKQIKC